MDKNFLGTGWRFPVSVDSAGEIELVEREADIAESIRIVLGTAKGERVMRPDFGCGIHDFAFATANATTLTLMETSVERALARWEPRIEVQNVEASAKELDDGRLPIRIDYRVRSSNNEFNLVYPFYLRER